MSESVSDVESTDAETADEQSALAAEVEVLREENQRLREEYARARQSQYRRTALTLGGIGLLATLAGIVFPPARTVLLALGGTGVFVGILTYYLSPEQFLPASVGRSIYDALARNEAAIAAELGLEDEHVYVPTGEDIGDTRLFVPHHAEYDLPDADALEGVFVVTDDDRERGLALEPTGGPLAVEVEEALTGNLGPDPSDLSAQLTDALVEQFELAAGTDTDVDAAGGRVSVRITDSSYGPVDRFDHPVVSLLAVGLAAGLDEPVITEVETVEDGRGDFLVTCRWETVD